MKKKLILTFAFTFLISACGQIQQTSTPVLVLLTSTPDQFCQPYEESLKVYQDGTNVVIENISTSPITVRISWDSNDPFAEGKGSDSYITKDPLESHQSFSREIKTHLSADVWAWNKEGKCIDQYSLIVTR
jgi:hypothetical protein